MSDEERFKIYDNYVKYFGIDSPASAASHAKQRDSWIPIRFCSQDWILAVWVFRVRWRTRFEIGLFLYGDHTKYRKDCGLRATIGMCLSEAYYRTGKMELHFVGKRNPSECTLQTGHEPVIPTSVRRIAEELGIRFLAESTISDQEGRRLYLRLTGFTAASEEIFHRRQIDLCHAAFLTQRGIWSKEQVEFLAREAIAPERLFLGGAKAEHRLSYLHDLIVMRVALMAERARTQIELLADSDESITETKWVSPCEQEMRCPKEFNFPCIQGKTPVAAGTTLRVVMLPLDSQSYKRSLSKLSATVQNTSDLRIVAVTQDFLSSGEDISSRLLDAKLRALVVVDSLLEMDSEIQHRLARAESSNRPTPEKPE